MGNESKIVVTYDDIERANVAGASSASNVSNDEKLVITYEDVARAMAADEQQAVGASPWGNGQGSFPSSTGAYVPGMGNQGRRTRFGNVRFHGLSFRNMSSQTKAVVALAVAFVAFLVIVVGACLLLFRSPSGSRGSGSFARGLYLYDASKSSRPLVEELCDLANETIVKIEVRGPCLVKDEESGEPEIRIASGFGTGTVIAADSKGRLLILTNFHVISNYYAGKFIADRQGADVNPRECNIRVMTSSGNSVPKEDCELLAVHKSETAERQGFMAILQEQFNGTDLALIRTPPITGIRPRFYISRRSNLRNGEHLITIGHPGGREFSPSEGTNQGIRDGRTDQGLRQYDIHAEIIAYNIPTNPGNSGGPVFDSKGRIVGVHTLGTKDQQLLNMGYPADEVLDIGKWEILVDDPALSKMFERIPRQ